MIIQFGFGQDTLVLINNDQLVGEVKSLEKGVLEMETTYSDDDFKIEWKNVKTIKTTTIFVVFLSDGIRITGSLHSTDSSKINVINNQKTYYATNDEIILFATLDNGFWSKIHANIDLGFNMTKASNLRQFNSASGIGYHGEKWMWEIKFTSLFSRQDSIEATKRTDGSVTANIYLPHDMFFTNQVNYLANTEQRLNYRYTGKTGLGYYFSRTNRMMFGGAAGVNFVLENYQDDEGDKISFEAFGAIMLNMFDFKNLSLNTTIVGYPGLTEKGRFRSDFDITFKYDLPFDFYVKLGATVNYDNQPVDNASETDYIINTGFGWEW